METRTRGSTPVEKIDVEEAVKTACNTCSHDILEVLSCRFPHIEGKGGQNEEDFLGLRKKVLRSINNAQRDILSKLGVEVIEVRQPYRVR